MKTSAISALGEIGEKETALPLVPTQRELAGQRRPPARIADPLQSYQKDKFRRNIMEANGAEFQISSQEGKGTLVEVVFPYFARGLI